LSIYAVMIRSERKIINYFMALLLIFAPLQMVHAVGSNMNCADSGKVAMQSPDFSDADKLFAVEGSENSGSISAIARHLDSPLMQDHQCTTCAPCSATITVDSATTILAGINPRPVSGKNSYSSFISPSLRPPIVSAI